MKYGIYTIDEAELHRLYWEAMRIAAYKTAERIAAQLDFGSQIYIYRKRHIAA